MPEPTRPVTPDEIAAFADDGVVCLRGALDPGVLAAMAGPIEQALRSDATAELSVFAPSPSGRFAAGVDHWREQPEFLTFACASDLPRLVAALLGTDALWLYEDSLLVKEPGTDVPTRWHQDLGYFHVDGAKLATTWCPLDRVTAETGAVRYVRGSHRWDATYRPTLFVTDDPIPDTDGDPVPDVDALAAAGECEIVTFTTAPGDVVVHHARTLHAAGPNRSATTRRRAISVRYCGDDVCTRLRPGAPRKPHQEQWSDDTPIVAVPPAEHPRVWPRHPHPAGPPAENAFYTSGMTMYEGPVFDADNHYYEALDAFTRHLDPRLGPRCVQWCDIDGRKYQVVGGRVSRVVNNPTFDPIAKAGAMHDYFRGNPEGRNPLEFLADREPIRAEYRDRDAWIRVLDEQGLVGCWLFPTLGMLYEELLLHDVEALGLTFTAFNRWVEEDWGFAYQDRIFAAPYLTLADQDWAITELEWAIEKGARMIVMRPAAQFTANGPRTPAHPEFDPFWSRVQEAGLTVVVHTGDSGYTANGYAPDGFSASFGSGNMGPSIKMLHMERAIYDFLASLVFDRFFTRFPGIRLASVENGSEFLPDLFRKLRSQHRRIPGFFPEDPIETFRRNVWINPFWEDDPYEIAELMGAERVIFGSDWPHIEGMPNPLDYAVEVKELDVAAQGLVLHDNAVALTRLDPH